MENTAPSAWSTVRVTWDQLPERNGQKGFRKTRKSPQDCDFWSTWSTQKFTLKHSLDCPSKTASWRWLLSKKETAPTGGEASWNTSESPLSSSDTLTDPTALWSSQLIAIVHRRLLPVASLGPRHTTLLPSDHVPRSSLSPNGSATPNHRCNPRVSLLR